jgi:hypothetical protein
LDKLFDGFLIEKIAADPVAGISGITDYRSVSEGFDDLLNQTQLRIYRIDFKQHVVDIFLCPRSADYSYNFRLEF